MLNVPAKGSVVMTSIILFICLAVFYGALKIILEIHLAPLDVLGEEGDLSDVAFSRGCSVYALFEQAGDVWPFSKDRIKNDFNVYLNTGDIPGYVRQYVRSQPPLLRDRTYSKLIFSGGRPPYL
jgi:hypothetical protein